MAGVFQRNVFIPNMGMPCSQIGKGLFPIWESFIPNMGMRGFM